MMTHRQVHGLSIIELCFICFIIVLLISLFAPPNWFHGHYEKPFLATCMNNQRQICIALLMWVNDHNESFPPPKHMWNDLRVKYNLVGKVYQCGQRRDLSYGYVYNAKASGTNYLLLSNPTGFLLTADGLSADHIAYSSRYLDPRHDSKVNGGFADGHVSTLSLPDATKAMRPILMSLPEKSAKSAK